MPIKKLEKEMKQIEKDIDEIIKLSSSRKSRYDPKIKAAVSKARVVMEKLLLHYNREQRDKDIEKKAFLNLIRAVGFFEENLREIERLLKAFLRQEGIDRREAEIDFTNSLTHLNYVEESINKVIINSESMIGSLGLGEKKHNARKHIPGTHSHFKELSRKAEILHSEFKRGKPVSRDVERILAWIMQYRSKDIDMSNNERKAFFSLLRSVQKYDNSLEKAHNSLALFAAEAGASAKRERSHLNSAKRAIKDANNAIPLIVKDASSLVSLLKKEERHIH